MIDVHEVNVHTSLIKFKSYKPLNTKTLNPNNKIDSIKFH
jgi:hypothetical protein